MMPKKQTRPETTADLFHQDPAQLQRNLYAHVNCGAPRPVWITITRNHTVMASVTRTDPQAVKWRLHQDFLFAAPSVWDAIRRYSIHGHKKDWTPIATYAQGISARKPPRPRDRKANDPVLTPLFKQINHTYFNEKLNCTIKWGSERSPKKRRSIRYGSYDRDRNLIRIHPALNNPAVPRRFLEYIIFHEALHALIPVESSGTRRIVHTKAFRKLERTFPDYEEMQLLAKTLVTRL